MPEEPAAQSFEFDLANNGSKLTFLTPEQLEDWNNGEFEKWRWVGTSGRPQLDTVFEGHRQLHAQLSEIVKEWRRWKQHPKELRNVFNNLTNHLTQTYNNRRILNSTSPEFLFISKLREGRGDGVAAGAYAALLSSDLQFGGPIRSPFIDGMIEAFLYKREVDWTASAHQEALNKLKAEYTANIHHQKDQLESLEQRNSAMNASFDETLKGKSGSLDQLHGDQIAEFKKLIDEHVTRLTNIEKTYDQKLALQKPVKYWQTKESYHTSRAKILGGSTLLTAAALGTGMGFLIHGVFLNLASGMDPKAWQIGIVLVAAFFSIWLARVLVRLFLSHVHLATDAAERRTMILTYLSMSREGAEFTKEDKKLIVQHLFRSASDGLVKDDAAPPSAFELLTRR